MSNSSFLCSTSSASLLPLWATRHRTPGKLSQQQVTPRTLTDRTDSAALLKSELLGWKSGFSHPTNSTSSAKTGCETKDEGVTPTCTAPRVSQAELWDAPGNWSAWASGQPGGRPGETSHGTEPRRHPTGWHPPAAPRASAGGAAPSPHNSPGQPDMPEEGAGQARQTPISTTS